MESFNEPVDIKLVFRRSVVPRVPVQEPRLRAAR